MSDLARATELAQLMQRQEKRIEEIQAQLTEATEAYNRTRLEDLPLLMAEVGLSSFKLADGSAVDVKEEVSASVTAEKKPAAFNWLSEHGFGGLIKTIVNVAFNATTEEREEAVKLARDLGADYESTTLKEDIHAQTLKSFVKERRAAGETLPEDLFSVHPYSVAKITPPKKPKGKKRSAQ